MDNSYLTSQVTSIVRSLHGIFDEIGVPDHDRETREAQLYNALSETLQSQLRLVNAEKNALIEEGNKLIAAIRQMNRAMDDSGRVNQYDELVVSYPLLDCVDELKGVQAAMKKEYEKRFEDVKAIVRSIESYASHMEEGFVRFQLPNVSTPNFNIKITAGAIQKLEAEFSRVYEEYTRRIATVKSLASEIVNLWAELGTPTHQLDRRVVETCRDGCKTFDIRADSITTLRSKKQKLSDEKVLREKKITDMHQQLQPLWEKFKKDDNEEQRFLSQNRGISLDVMANWEAELNRLLEVKKEHMYLFIDDSRQVLQELWDALYYGEEEMLAFEPAFSKTYTEALLRAHEMEISRLQKIVDERAPILALVEKYQTLINDKSSLEASAQDASRLMGKGPRDPTRLLREEKMRKRIAKDLPKIESDLIAALETWEAERGEIFKVHGEAYLDIIMEKHQPSNKHSQSAATVLRATAQKTGPAKTAPTPKSAPPARPGSVAGARGGAKTPSVSRATAPRTATKSPTPFNRPPLANYTQNGQNSPERRTGIPVSRSKTPGPGPSGRNTPGTVPSKTPTSVGGTIRRLPAYMAQQAAQTSANNTNSGPIRVGPPKMKPLQPASKITSENMPPPSNFASRDIFDEMPSSNSSSAYSSPMPEIPMRPESYSASRQPPPTYNNLGSSINFKSKPTASASSYEDVQRVPSLTSQASTATSNATNTTCSENWETFGEDSDEEMSARSHYYDKLKAVKDKRNFDHYGSGSKKARGILNGGVRAVHVRNEESGDWEDDDEMF